MTPWSATAWADAPVGAIPGSASAAARSALAAGGGAARSVAATPAPADAVAAGRGFLARVDVLLDLRFELVGVDLHRRLGEIAAFPGLRRLDRRTAGRDKCHEKDERTQRMAHRNLRNRR